MSLGVFQDVWFSSRLKVFHSMLHVKTRVTLTIFNDLYLLIVPILECVSSLYVVTRIYD